MTGNGKKLDCLQLPKQLRTDQETGRLVRQLAELDFRTIQDQLRHLLALGLECEHQRHPELFEEVSDEGSHLR